MEFKVEGSKKLYDDLCEKHPQYPAIWKYIVALTEIPRPTGHMSRVVAWTQEMGKKLGGSVKTDAAGNVCVSIPATKGLEDKPGVVLQAHLDMVPTKTSGFAHDFANDPIHAWVDGDLLRAKDTTLGADDGSGVAAILAVAEDKEMTHGPLELLFTVDEECGLVGAQKLQEGELLSKTSKYLVNVDSEDWGEFTLSCAGAVDRMIKIPVKRSAYEPAEWATFTLKLQDFKGGHSGADIHVGRCNAIKWATAMLLENKESMGGCPIRIAQLRGGNAHNAIPSDFDVVFGVPEERSHAFVSAASDVFHLLNLRFSHIEKTADKEPRFSFRRVSAAETPKDALTFSSTRTVLRFLEAVHHGVWRWSEEIESLVETSQSLSKAELGAESLDIEVFARSSDNVALKVLPKLLEALAELYGGKSLCGMQDTPGWPAQPDSHLCKTAVACYKRRFGEDAKLSSIHAGLECGIILNKFPGNQLEAISVGPTVRCPHTVDEHMELSTAVKLYDFLHLLVHDLAQQ